LKSNAAIANVAINGYKDRLGSDKYNKTLSEKRANAVKTYLVSKGVSADRLTTVGKGETNPVVECKMKKRAELIQCLEPNPRVEVEEITFQRRVK
jgi:OOP family OmpA-OmpF porin